MRNNFEVLIAYDKGFMNGVKSMDKGNIYIYICLCICVIYIFFASFIILWCFVPLVILWWLVAYTNFVYIK